MQIKEEFEICSLVGSLHWEFGWERQYYQNAWESGHPPTVLLYKQKLYEGKIDTAVVS